MSDKITVHYVIGHDPQTNQRVELAKFFQRGHADDHVTRLGRWYNVSVEAREERLEDQHPAHVHTAISAG